MQDKPRWCDCFGYYCLRSLCVEKLLKARAERNRQGRERYGAARDASAQAPDDVPDGDVGACPDRGA